MKNTKTRFVDKTTKEFIAHPVKIRNLIKASPILRPFIGHSTSSSRVSGWGNVYGLIHADSYLQDVKSEPNKYVGNVCYRTVHNIYSTRVTINKSCKEVLTNDLKTELLKVLQGIEGLRIDLD